MVRVIHVGPCGVGVWHIFEIKNNIHECQELECQLDAGWVLVYFSHVL